MSTPPGYGNGWKEYLQHAFDLRSATGTVTLSYQDRYHLQNGVDFAYVEVSSNGGLSWTQLASYTGPVADNQVRWRAGSVNLSAYRGSNVLVRFRVYSNEENSDEDGLFNSDGAFFVDEIRLTDGSGTLFYDNVESGAGSWEATRYVRAPDLAGTSFWNNADEVAGDGLDNDGNGFVDDLGGWDFINSDAHPNDDNAHGTHVTGTIAQTMNNGFGVAGVAFGTTVMPVKVLNAAGSGTSEGVAEGILYAVENGADVISLSLGGPAAAVLESAVAYAYAHGVTVVAASGNNNAGSVSYPAAYDAYVIAVGATQYNEARAPYSNYGSSLDLVAPGGNTAVDQNGDGYADGVLQNTFGDTPVDWAYWFYQGTSMATPHVSGVAALLLVLDSTLTPDQVRYSLEYTAEDKGVLGRDDVYGWGLIDAEAALARAREWPMFRHDLLHTAYSSSKAPNANASLWSFTTGSIVRSSPAVIDGRVYIGSDDNNVYCLEASSSALIWSYTTGGIVYSSPAVADGKVYVGSFDNKVYCLNATSGTPIWSYTTGNEVRTSPSIVDGKVYVGSYDNKLYCLNATSGTVIWSYTTGGWAKSSPAVVGGRVYVGSNDYKVYCLNASDGALIWSYTTGNQVYSSPAVVDGKVYVGSWDNKVYFLNAVTGSYIWSYATGNEVYSSPAVADGKVYVGSFDNKVYCLNATSGTPIWTYTTGNWVHSSPTVAYDKVYVGSWDGKVYCFGSPVSVYLNLFAAPNPDQAVYVKGQSVTLEVTVFNQLNPPLNSTLTLTVTGPSGYYHYDSQPVSIAADEVKDYSFSWSVPDVAGTYVAEVELVPAQLTAYDALWLKVN